MKLLTVGNTKTLKGESKGYMTFILHLAPSTLSGYNVCPMASLGCIAGCLNTAGHGGMFKKDETTNKVQEARKRKTVMFFEQRDEFLSLLVKDIRLAIKQAAKRNMTPVFRLNGTSDIRWETVAIGEYANIMAMFPDITFYDYSKLLNRRDLPQNYTITLSRSETNESSVLSQIDMHNVAVVFDNVPATYQGIPVINGDEHDLRFLDEKGVIVGLKAKGRAKKDTSGFVVKLAA